MRESFALAMTLAAAAVSLGACRYDWVTDMWFQPAIRSEEDPRPEPEHTIPLGVVPGPADRDEAESLQNPVRADAASIKHGAAIFQDRCIGCHGREGHGGGPVGKFFPPAPDLAYATVKARSDGYIFGTITFGGRAMPPMGDGLTPHDRWDVVNEVRVIQGFVPPEGR